MAQAVAQVDRDQAIWGEWVAGSTMAKIGDRYGLGRAAVSEAIHRYHASIPEPERAAYRARCLERTEELYQAHRQAGLTNTRAGNLVLRTVLAQAHLLGLAPREVKVEHGGAVEMGHTWDRGPTVEELLERWRAEGKLRTRAEITRLDQGGGE